MSQSIFQNQHGEVIISAVNKIYQDTLENFKKDHPSYSENEQQRIYNQTLGVNVVDGVIQDFPWEKGNQIIASIESILKQQAGRQPKPAPITPTPEELKQQAVANLNAEYLPQIDALLKAYSLAQMDGDIQTAEEIQAEYTALRQEYNAKMEVISNG